MPSLSKTQIANLALSMMGSKARISNLAEQSTEAHHLNLHFDHAVATVLEARDWGFAQKRAVLALTTDTPVGGYAYAYALPSDCLAVRYLDHSLGVEDTPRYQLGSNGTQRLLYTDEEGAAVVYTFDAVDNPQLMSPLFIETVAAVLAVRVCMPIANDRALRAELRQQAVAALSAAGASDANQDSNLDTGAEADWLRDR